MIEEESTKKIDDGVILKLDEHEGMIIAFTESWHFKMLFIPASGPPRTRGYSPRSHTTEEWWLIKSRNL